MNSPPRWKYPVSKPSLTFRERQLLLEAFDSGQITSGPMVERLEREFAAYLDVPYAVATSSGTTALHLVLAALGIKRYDEVIVPDLTYVATANAVAYAGARPVFVDIGATTYGLDARLTANAITRRTRAIMPVHLYGRVANVSALVEVARQHGLWVIEDAAEGLGGSYGPNGPALGTVGTAGCFSFYGNKVMTTGEGGMVVTRDEGLAQRLRSLRCMANHPTRRYAHTGIGFNYRMTDLQAAIGIGQLQRLPTLLEQRRRVIACYLQRFARSSIYVPSGAVDSDHAPWLFTFELPEGIERERVMQRLADKGIETRPTFVPMHEVFNVPEYGRGFPVSKRVSERGLSLPTYPDLTDDDVRYIADEVIACLP